MNWRSKLKTKTCPLPSFDLSHAIELSQVHNNATLICRDSSFCILIRRLYLHEPYKFGLESEYLATTVDAHGRDLKVFFLLCPFSNTFLYLRI